MRRNPPEQQDRGEGRAGAAAPEPIGDKAVRRRRREQVGVVVSAKMQKTVVVAVERLVQHDVYRKTIKRTSTFMAHDEKGARRGDRVRILETRPLSKNKRWRVEEILTRGLLTEDETVEA